MYFVDGCFLRACIGFPAPLFAPSTLLMDNQQMSSYADGTKAAHMDLSAPSDTAEWRSVCARDESTDLIMASSPRLSPFDACILLDQL